MVRRIMSDLRQWVVNMCKSDSLVRWVNVGFEFTIVTKRCVRARQSYKLMVVSSFYQLKIGVFVFVHVSNFAYKSFWLIYLQDLFWNLISTVYWYRYYVCFILFYQGILDWVRSNRVIRYLELITDVVAK